VHSIGIDLAQFLLHIVKYGVGQIARMGTRKRLPTWTVYLLYHKPRGDIRDSKTISKVKMGALARIPACTDLIFLMVGERGLFTPR
jgi:hypothetical protein